MPGSKPGAGDDFYSNFWRKLFDLILQVLSNNFVCLSLFNLASLSGSSVCIGMPVGPYKDFRE